MTNESTAGSHYSSGGSFLSQHSIFDYFSFQIIYIHTQKTNNLTTKSFVHLEQKGQKKSQNNRLTFWQVEETTNQVETEPPPPIKKIKMVLHEDTICLAGGRKHFSTLPRFLSTHMTCTCGYMLRGCIQLNVYSHAPAHQTSVNHSSHTVPLRSAFRVKKQEPLLMYSTLLLF